MARPDTLAHWFGVLSARSILSVPLYGVTLFTVFVPVPHWGLTPDVAQHVMPTVVEGPLFDHPERALAGAAIYFALLGVIEIFWLDRISRKMGTPDF